MGLTLEFQYQDFYAGIRAGGQLFHLKLSDEKDPTIEFVDKGEHFHLYFETDDASAAAVALKRNGVPLVQDVLPQAVSCLPQAQLTDSAREVGF
ncbi:MAG TPA: hypothetical protein VK638_32625 [Edaphobacter sp.]|nr:hypothetical protein [Edaphobacter sp.]